MKRPTITLALWLAAALLGCGSQEEPAHPKPAVKEPAIRESRQATPEMKAAAPEREEYFRQANSRLEELKRGMAEMQDRLDKISPELKARVAEQLKALEPQMATARRKLQELKFATGETYKKLQAEMETLLNDLKKAVEQLPTGFQFKP
jgi:chromosome segregation ATPase